MAKSIHSPNFFANYLMILQTFTQSCYMPYTVYVIVLAVLPLLYESSPFQIMVKGGQQHLTYEYEHTFVYL